MNLLKRQRDAVGLSIYSDHYDYYSNEKGSERHHQMLLAKLNEILVIKEIKLSLKLYTTFMKLLKK